MILVVRMLGMAFAEHVVGLQDELCYAVHDMTRQDMTWHETRRDETIRDVTRRDEARRDETRRDETTRHDKKTHSTLPHNVTWRNMTSHIMISRTAIFVLTIPESRSWAKTTQHRTLRACRDLLIQDSSRFELESPQSSNHMYMIYIYIYIYIHITDLQSTVTSGIWK